MATLKDVNGRDADFDAGRALEWSDGLPARGIRRASIHRSQTLRRDLLDQSTLWRQS
jgi:hypothetical protein